MAEGGYVCAFRGRRDSYQVPLALAERGRLARFVTEAYFTPGLRSIAAALPRRLRRAAESRWQEGLPDRAIHCLWATAAAERLLRTAAVAPAAIYELLDGRFGLAAAKAADRTAANMLLYSPYAWAAFSRDYNHSPRKLLFQYHPHIQLEERILSSDAAAFPDIFPAAESRLENVVAAKSPLRQMADASWSVADLNICASSFTAQSLHEAGASPKSIRVTPYGVDLPPELMATAIAGPFHALFVGTGTQRKGLHHLLLAWSRAKLPSDSRLTVVARVVDPRLEGLISTTRGTELLRGVSAPQLQGLYRSASLFVMPSLVEGFGQVYLEALSHGLPVLGTTNTCLPDIGGEDQGVFTTPPGDVERLADTLRAAQDFVRSDRLRSRARDCAAAQTWAKFRDGIGALL